MRIEMSRAINAGRTERKSKIVGDVNNDVATTRLFREVEFPVFGATVKVTPHVYAPWKARGDTKEEVSCVTSVIGINIEKEDRDKVRNSGGPWNGPNSEGTKGI